MVIELVAFKIKDTQKTNKTVKRYSISSVIRKM